MNFKNINEKIKACGASHVFIFKKGLSVFWPTRETARAAKRIALEKGCKAIAPEKKYSKGWSVLILRGN